jgi:hypothetical protein
MDIKKTDGYDLNWTELTPVIQDRISCDDCFENWSFIKVVKFLVIWVAVTVQKAHVSREISVSRERSLRDTRL